ncbi:hypothetical protein [Lysobacter sp. Root690]|uniref:hypothetical protein n=1 Tax=Lysobacter sp. Root690 TaxID=1736588 RepID=UPI0012FC3D3A|nr:hypothetical protein [Lysobacter sp. Root690]
MANWFCRSFANSQFCAISCSEALGRVTFSLTGNAHADSKATQINSERRWWRRDFIFDG